MEPIQNAAIDSRYVKFHKKTADTFHAVACFLTPALLSGLIQTVFLPALTILCAWAAILAGGWAIQECSAFRPLNALSGNPIFILLAVITGSVMWCIECFGGYPCTEALLGRRIYLKVSPRFITIGGRLFPKRFPRAQHRIQFVCEPLASAPVGDVYCNSARLAVVIDRRTIYLSEVFGAEKCVTICNSLNTCLELSTPRPGEGNNMPTVPLGGMASGSLPLPITIFNARIAKAFRRLADLLHEQ